jgi:hypothetical protein
MAGGDHCPLRRRFLAQGHYQGRLADTRFASEEDESAVAGKRRGQFLAQELLLSLAANEERC